MELFKLVFDKKIDIPDELARGWGGEGGFGRNVLTRRKEIRDRRRMEEFCCAVVAGAARKKSPK